VANKSLALQVEKGTIRELRLRGFALDNKETG
jgi:hypothetical protein